MLSYQHGYHAGNAADVHKHALLAWILDYLTRKDKPLSYLETHGGRGLYDLASDQAQRTGEAAHGIGRLQDAFAAEHPYFRAIAATQSMRGEAAYPGSPLIAAHLLRAGDKMDIAELHPAEHDALTDAMAGRQDCRLHRRDGWDMVRALTPPEPRRGVLLIDPSWEIRDDYARAAALLPKLHRKWGVGILMLWYPILPDRRHRPMVQALQDALPEVLVTQTRFAPAREGHGMEGSGLLVVNPPWGLAEEARRLEKIIT